MRPLVRRQARLGQAGRPEPAPVSEADEDHVAGGRRDEAGEQRRGERRAESRSARLDHHHAADDRSAEERRDGRERARAGEQGALALAETEDRRHGDADDHPQRDQRHLRPEDRAERERAQRRERDPGCVRERGRLLALKADQRGDAAVAREEDARDEDDARTRERQAEHEVPRRRRVAEMVRQVAPEPVLEVVHECEEERGEERGRDADHGSSPTSRRYEVPPRSCCSSAKPRRVYAARDSPSHCARRSRIAVPDSKLRRRGGPRAPPRATRRCPSAGRGAGRRDPGPSRP